jgi:hypothetical protein
MWIAAELAAKAAPAAGNADCFSRTVTESAFAALDAEAATLPDAGNDACRGADDEEAWTETSRADNAGIVAEPTACWTFVVVARDACWPTTAKVPVAAFAVVDATT